jgi:hypothetical protein
MGLLKQVIGSAIAARAFGARSSAPLLIASVLARRASPLMIAAIAFLASAALQSRRPAPQRIRQPGRQVGRARR